MRLALLLLLACDAPEDPVLAVIDGAPIHRSEVERGVAMEIYQRHLDIHSLMKAELDRIVEGRLLAAEAAHRGVTVEAMLQEIDKTAPPVTEAQIEEELSERPADRERVRAYLEGRARFEQRIALVERLRQKAGVEVRLEAPHPPRIDVDVRGAPSRGPEDGPVTIVHFGSFSDPKSHAMVTVIASYVRAHPERIRWIHRHALRPGDELGLEASLLSLMAQRNGRFWELHDALFAAGTPLTKATLERVAREMEIGDPLIDRDEGDLLLLKQEHDVARRSGVQTPPVVFVNGRWFQGSFGGEKLSALIDDELRLGQPSVR